MRHIIIRTGINCYTYLVQSLKRKAGPSACLKVNQDNFNEFVEKLAYRPMFSKFYLVELEFTDTARGEFKKFITDRLLTSNWIQCIIYVHHTELFEELKEVYKGYDILFYNSYSVSDEYLAKYIRRYIYDATSGEQIISMELARYIRKRVKYQDYLLDSKLDLLAHAHIDKKSIRQIIPRYRGVKVSTFPYHFFRQDKESEIGSFISRYQYSIDYLYKPMISFLETWVSLYSEYLSGNLTPLNYMDWIVANGSRFSISYKYQIENWLWLLENYSYELVISYSYFLYKYRNAGDFEKTLAIYKLMKELP